MKTQQGRTQKQVEGVQLLRAASFLINDAAMKFRANERELGGVDSMVASMLDTVPDARNRLAKILYDLGAELKDKADRA